VQSALTSLEARVELGIRGVEVGLVEQHDRDDAALRVDLVQREVAVHRERAAAVRLLGL
jgi:hypothetical protein